MKTPHKLKRRVLCSLLLFLSQSLAGAQERSLDTDRPDKTDSAITVDAGHYQLELDFASWTRDQDSSSRLDAWQVGDFNLRLGLTDFCDLQLGFSPWQSQASLDLKNGSQSQAQGNGDFVGRLKVNFWGDNGGDTSLGLIPFVKLPLASQGQGNGASEGGLILPFGLSLGLGFNLNTEAAVAINLNSSGSGYHADSSLSASLGHDLGMGVSAYLEYWTLFSGEDAVPGQQSLDTGLLWGLSPNLQLDFSINAGLNPPADDLNPCAGLSWRI